MHISEFVEENKIRKILWVFQIQTDHFMHACKLDQMTIKKKKKTKTCHLVIFAVSAKHREKTKESETIDKYLEFFLKTKNAAGHDGDSDTNCNSYNYNCLQSLEKGDRKKWKWK